MADHEFCDSDTSYSMQRTSSQRTVATQLSIPLSTSASNVGLLGERRPSFGSGNLLSANSHGAGAGANSTAGTAAGGAPDGAAPVASSSEATAIGAGGASKDVEQLAGEGEPVAEGETGAAGTSASAATAAASEAVESHVERLAEQEQTPAAAA